VEQLAAERRDTRKRAALQYRRRLTSPIIWAIAVAGTGIKWPLMD